MYRERPALGGIRWAVAMTARACVAALAVYGGLSLSRAALAQGENQAYVPRANQAQSAEALEARVTALEDLLVHMTREGDDVFFTGANVHIVNGSGSTDGDTNGLGNLVVGYNEGTAAMKEHGRTGSHMLVIGSLHTYTSYGGIVAGQGNAARAPMASVLGGLSNEAFEDYAVISGGSGNTALGPWSVVSGGTDNEASAQYASIAGGSSNKAKGLESAIAGGHYNTAEGRGSTVAGGDANTAVGEHAVVSGGSANRASGNWSAVSGGGTNIASGVWAVVSAGGSNVASGQFAAVSGGEANTAAGTLAVVSGGLNRAAPDGNNWAAGSLFESF